MLLAAMAGTAVATMAKAKQNKRTFFIMFLLVETGLNESAFLIGPGKADFAQKGSRKKK
jgi:hypothetical protein